MKAIRRLPPLAALSAMVLIAVLAGCGKENPAPSAQNLTPDTTLELLADRGDTTSLKVRFRWAGSDPDGEVVCFETRWDSLAWVRVVRTDSVFVLSQADSTAAPLGSGRHTFAVRAVDDRGAEDPSPASVSFTARNLLPETEIVNGPAAITCPIVRIEWRGWDYDGIVVGYGWTLYRWEVEDWIAVAGEDSVGPDVVSLVEGPMAGLHRFDVWSIDDAGDADPTPATLTFTANPVLEGARLTVRSNALGTMVYRGWTWSPQWDTPIPILEGEHLVFDWHADVSECGGEIAGYAVSYDDTSAWGGEYSLDETHLEVTPTVGEHAIYWAAADDLGMITRGKLAVEVIAASMDQYVLIVDDFDWHESIAIWGTDEDRDAFYDDLTLDCSRPTLQWDVGDELGEPPDLATLADASTVVWYYDHEEPALRTAFDPAARRYAPLAGYVRGGGNLILAGWKGISHIVGEDYPIEVTDADTTAGRVFVRDALGIDRAENSGLAANKGSPWTYGYCFYGAVPKNPLGTGVQLEAMYIDSLGTWWPLYGMDNPNYSHGGLPMVDALRSWSGGGVEAQVTDAYLNMNFEREPCTIVAVPEEGYGQACYFGFPLYYLQAPQVRRVFYTLLERCGEL